MGVLLAIWVAFNAPAFAGRVLFPVDLEGSVAETGSPTGRVSNPLDSDAYSLYYPLRVYLGSRLQEGDIPLWDPHRFSGTPFAANPQAAVWYPPNWFFAVGDPLLVYSWILILTRLVGLLLTYWFLRVLSLHPFAAAAGAVVFVGSGFIMAWGTHMTFPASAIWLPLALGGLTQVFKGRVATGVPLAAAGLALSLLGGHPQVSLFVWLSAGLWAAVWIVASAAEKRSGGFREAARSVLAPGGFAALSFVLGVGLASLQLLSTLTFSRSIVRGVEPYEGLVAAALPIRHAMTLLVPDRFGNPIDGNHIGPVNYVEGAIYAGVLTLVLAAVALWHRRDRVTAGFATIGLVGSLAAFGTPVYAVLHTLVPGLSRLRGVGRFGFLLDTALAGLAAVGLDQVLRPSNDRRRRAVALAGVVTLAALVMSVTVLNRGALPASYVAPRFAFAATLLLIGAVLLFRVGKSGRWMTAASIAVVLVIAADLWVFGFRYHPFQPARPIHRGSAATRFVLSSGETRPRIARLFYYWIPANGALTTGLYDIQGYDGLIPTRYVELVSLIEDQSLNARGFNVIYNFSDPDRLRSPIADLLGLRFVLAPIGQEGLGQELVRSRYSVFDHPTSLPPAFVVHCWEAVLPGSAPDRLRGMSSSELRSNAVIDLGTAQLPTAHQSNCDPGHPASIERYDPDSIEIRVVTPEPALVVLTDEWDEGWTATVDGVSRPVARVYHALRGVFVGAGRHQIEMTYRPGWLAPGILITLGAIMTVTAFLVFGAWWARSARDQFSGSQRKR